MTDSIPEETESEVVDAEIVGSGVERKAAALGLELPSDPEAGIELLLGRLEEARDEATAYLDDLKRVAADFDNYRKRSTREQAAIIHRAAERVVRELLPVLDTFDAAVAVEPSTDSERQLLSGMLNTREQLLKALEREGLEVIDSHDQPFDPELHEPIGPSSGDGRPTVAGELRRGYRLNGKVIRAALVTLDNE